MCVGWGGGGGAAVIWEAWGLPQDGRCCWACEYDGGCAEDGPGGAAQGAAQLLWSWGSLSALMASPLGPEPWPCTLTLPQPLPVLPVYTTPAVKTHPPTLPFLCLTLSCTACMQYMAEVYKTMVDMGLGMSGPPACSRSGACGVHNGACSSGPTQPAGPTIAPPAPVEEPAKALAGGVPGLPARPGPKARLLRLTACSWLPMSHLVLGLLAGWLAG